jgi:hypothetical protein
MGMQTASSTVAIPGRKDDRREELGCPFFMKLDAKQR